MPSLWLSFRHIMLLSAARVCWGRALSAQSLHTTSGYIVHQIVFLSSTPIHRGDKMLTFSGTGRASIPDANAGGIAVFDTVKKSLCYAQDNRLLPPKLVRHKISWWDLFPRLSQAAMFVFPVCSNSIVKALWLMESCTKPSKCIEGDFLHWHWIMKYFIGSKTSTDMPIFLFQFYAPKYELNFRIKQWAYRQTSNIRRTKSQNLNVSLLVSQLSLPNPLKPGVKSRMKI